PRRPGASPPDGKPICARASSPRGLRLSDGYLRRKLAPRLEPAAASVPPPARHPSTHTARKGDCLPRTGDEQDSAPDGKNPVRIHLVLNGDMYMRGIKSNAAEGSRGPLNGARPRERPEREIKHHLALSVRIEFRHDGVLHASDIAHECPVDTRAVGGKPAIR